MIFVLDKFTISLIVATFALAAHSLNLLIKEEKTT
jgi:hypothetical protein